jgi:hypothetical protein
MFDGLSRDFGSVPRGPMVSHHFVFVNNTRSPVQISGLRVSCGCVTAKALHQWVAPGQRSAILAEMDTRRFIGTKTVTIYVSFSQPGAEEVRLWVQANSRDDVTMTPETLAFGKVKRSTAPSTSLKVSLLGSSTWQITSAACESNYVQTSYKMTSRQSHEVVYELMAKMRSDAPPGKWYTDVWLTTNNPAMPRVRVPLTIEIEALLTVNPGIVVIGDVKAGTEAERKVMVRGVQPFKIVSIQGTDAQLKVRESSKEAKAVHVLTLTLRPTQMGELNRTIRVVTNLQGDNTVEFIAQATVQP